MGRSAFRLGALLFDAERFNESEPLLREAIALFKKAGDLAAASGVLKTLAALLARTGREYDGKQVEAEAAGIDAQLQKRN